MDAILDTPKVRKSGEQVEREAREFQAITGRAQPVTFSEWQALAGQIGMTFTEAERMTTDEIRFKAMAYIDAERRRLADDASKIIGFPDVDRKAGAVLTILLGLQPYEAMNKGEIIREANIRFKILISESSLKKRVLRDLEAYYVQQCDHGYRIDPQKRSQLPDFRPGTDR